MPRDSAAADRPASYLVGTAAAFPLFFRDRTKPINQLPFSPSAKFPKSGSSCESRARPRIAGITYRAGGAGAQATAQSERTRVWLLANRFQAIALASIISARLGNTELASQWLRR